MEFHECLRKLKDPVDPKVQGFQKLSRELKNPVNSEEENACLRARDTEQPGYHIGKYYGTIESRMGYRIMLGWQQEFRLLSRVQMVAVSCHEGLASHGRLLNGLSHHTKWWKIRTRCGCGEGHGAMHLARCGKMRVHGIDIITCHVLKM